MKLILLLTALLGIAIVIFSMEGNSQDQQSGAYKPAATSSSSVMERGLNN